MLGTTLASYTRRKCEASCHAGAGLDVVHHVFVYVGSIWVFGVTAIAHLLIIAAVVITVSTFEVAKRKPDSFVKKEV